MTRRFLATTTAVIALVLCTLAPAQAETVYSISTGHVHTKPVGERTNVWGTVRTVQAPVAVWTEAYVGGRWLTSQKSTTNASGGYALPLTYGMNQEGTHQFRVSALAPDGSVVRSEPFTIVRTWNYSISVSHVQSKPLGQTTNAWGTVKGVTKSVPVWTEVNLSGRWVTSQKRVTNSKGGYSIPLTYGINDPGTHTYRIAAQVPGGIVRSRQFNIVRTGTTARHAKAVATAKQYLRFMPFSRDGLIGQLVHDGYTTAEATYGADHSGANWYAQSMHQARSYLQSTPFSREGLIEQLRDYDEFTHGQAVFGVDHTGANWYYQAVLSAQGYLELWDDFTYDDMVYQLEVYDLFTHGEATFAARHVFGLS